MSKSGTDLCQLQFSFSNKYELGWFLSNQLFLLERISWIFLVYKIKKSNFLLFDLPPRTEWRQSYFPIISLFFLSFSILNIRTSGTTQLSPKELKQNQKGILMSIFCQNCSITKYSLYNYILRLSSVRHSNIIILEVIF